MLEERENEVSGVRCQVSGKPKVSESLEYKAEYDFAWKLTPGTLHLTPVLRRLS